MQTTIEIGGDSPDEMAKRAKDKIATVATMTMREAGGLMKQAARAAIAGGGFSGRWQNALRVKNYPESGVSDKPAAFMYHNIKYAGQFEDPQPVNGRPLIWLPITQNLPAGTRWTPHKFTLQIGALRSGRNGSRPVLFGQVSVSGAGKPVKLSRKGLRARQSRKVWLPVFVGVSSVHDPQRFDTGAAVAAVGNQLPDMYAKNWDSADG
jgi:hypothetical protein